MKINKEKILKIIKEKSLKALKLSGFAFVIMFFGTYAGSEGTSKDWRRVGIPVTFFLVSLFTCPLSWWLLTTLQQHWVLRMGHGTPSSTDEGSMLGKFYYKIFKGNNFWINFFTRGTIATLLSICFISVPILKGNWFEYLYCSIGIIITFALVQWRNLGTYELKINNKIVYACKSDAICYGVLGALGFMIII